VGKGKKKEECEFSAGLGKKNTRKEDEKSFSCRTKKKKVLLPDPPKRGEKASTAKGKKERGEQRILRGEMSRDIKRKSLGARELQEPCSVAEKRGRVKGRTKRKSVGTSFAKKKPNLLTIHKEKRDSTTNQGKRKKRKKCTRWEKEDGTPFSDE